MGMPPSWPNTPRTFKGPSFLPFFLQLEKCTCAHRLLTISGRSHTLILRVLSWGNDQVSRQEHSPALYREPPSSSHCYAAFTAF